MTETKQQLRDEVAQLSKQVEQLKEEKYSHGIAIASEICHKELRAAFGRTYQNVTYLRADDSGYWFSYQVYENNEYVTHTISIRHKEVRAENAKQYNIIQSLAEELMSLSNLCAARQDIQAILQKYGARFVD